MKKSILIALAVAFATCAQGQTSNFYDNSTEYVNPYKGYAYDYVNNDRLHGHWYLENESKKSEYKKYPVLEEYNNEIFVKIGSEGNKVSDEIGDYYYKYIHFCIGYDFLDSLFLYQERDFYINIKAKIFSKYYNVKYVRPSVYYIDDNDKIYPNIYNFRVTDEKNFHHRVFDDYMMGIGTKDSIVYSETSTKLLSKRFIIGFKLEIKDFYYFKDIEISITDEDGFEYFKKAYFTEEERKGLVTTSINNDMESNIYVSNNVLYTDEPSSVYIFNAGGILVKTEHNGTTVDLSDLKKGVYIAKVNEKTIEFVK